MMVREENMPRTKTTTKAPQGAVVILSDDEVSNNDSGPESFESGNQSMMRKGKNVGFNGSEYEEDDLRDDLLDDDEVLNIDDEDLAQTLAKNQPSAIPRHEQRGNRQIKIGAFLHAVEVPTRNDRRTTPERQLTNRLATTLVITPKREKRRVNAPKSTGHRDIASFFQRQGPSVSASMRRETVSQPAAKRYRSESSESPAPTWRRKKVINSDDESDFKPEGEDDSDGEGSEAFLDELEDDAEVSSAVNEDVDMSDVSDIVETKLKTKKNKVSLPPTVYRPISSGVQVRGAGATSDDLPPISDIYEMFDDIVLRVAKPLTEVSDAFSGNKLRVGTMCSGTESPLLALQMITRSMKKLLGKTFVVEHLFSCEIEPYKQAYIERNFRPPILFRDITELGRDYATTAYGAQAKVPGNIDLLVAGTSCVDFSNLNNKKQELSGAGESGATFHGMLRYVDKYRTPLVIIENVSGGPWDEMVAKFRGIGYSATYQRLDTKQFYIPHTRQRGYMVAVCGDSKLPSMWLTLTKDLQRPATCTLDAFLLPSDDPRTGLSRVRMLKESSSTQRQAIDWTRCESRHQKARAEEKLGNRRPFTNWQQQGVCTVPDFAWQEWFVKQVERVMDLTDISILRSAKKGVDPSFKTQVWNLSQNVDRSTSSSKAGISPCLTPTMIPYITNRGGIMVGYEALSMQGLPINELLLTRETQDQLADLAGNAMSSTVVGSCIVAGLILGVRMKIFDLQSGDKMEIDNENIVPRIINEIKGEEKLSWSTVNLSNATVSISELLDYAQRSARMCACEGRSGMANDPIQVCMDCGFSSCTRCGVKPPHNYRPLSERDTKRRVSPIEFEEQVKGRIPMRLSVNGVTGNFLEKARTQLESEISKSIKESIWAKWFESITRALGSEFRFRELKRQDTWSIFYESPHGVLELLLDPKQPEWRLFGKPEINEPASAEIRKILDHPVARQKVKDVLLGQNWEICLPIKLKIPITITGAGNLVESWEASLGLEEPQFANKKVWDRLSIEYDAKFRKYLDLDISGIYNLHRKCGNACNSLHAKEKADGEVLPIYFFLDPGTCTDNNDDFFVFAINNRRYVYGESRPLQARMDTSFRQSDKKTVNTHAFIDGFWVAAENAVLTQPTSDSGKFGIPNKSLRIVSNHSSCAHAQAILACKVPLHTQAEAVWPENDIYEVSEIKERTVFTSLAWLTEPVKLFKDLEEWRETPLEDLDDCPRCAPRRPDIRWLKVSGRFKAIEDREQAGPYEQALKKRPSPFVTHIQMDKNLVGTFKVGLNAATLIHRALANLPYSRLAGDTTVSWRLVTGYTAPPSVTYPAFTIPNNREDPKAAQPPHFTALPLRQEQLRSLHWMIAQEAEDAKPFIEEEICEALLPHLGWRAEGRAQRPLFVKGGVLADDVGYGKTAVTVGLIDANRNKPLKADVLPGLIPTKATLIVVPSHLCKQWPAEIRKFAGVSTFNIVTVFSQTDINNLSVKAIQKADIVIVSAAIFSSGAYLKYLSHFSKSPSPPNAEGRQFSHWVDDTIVRLRESVRLIQEEGGTAGYKAIKSYRDFLAAEAEGFVQGKRLKGEAFRKARQSLNMNKSDKKRKRKNSDDDSDMDSDEATEEPVTDVWKLQKIGKDLSNLACPPLAMFHWNRLVIDEYTYHIQSAGNKNVLKIKKQLEKIEATNKWILSGTPPLEDFNDVQAIASFLNIHLGIVDESGIKQQSVRKKLNDSRTAAEKFQALSEAKSPHWSLHRHEQAQRFLSQFVRKNVPLIEEIPYEVFFSKIKLPPFERAVYLELEHHLKALDYSTRRKGKKDTDSDRDRRLNKSLEKSATGEEALVKRVSFFDMGQPDKSGMYSPRAACERIVDTRKAQLSNCAGELREMYQEQFRAIKALGSAAGKEEHFMQYGKRINGGTVDDWDATLRVRELYAEAKQFPNKVFPKVETPKDDEEENLPKGKSHGKSKGKKSIVKDENDPKSMTVDDKIWAIREKTHEIKRIEKEFVGRVRSLRYFQLVRDLQEQISEGVTDMLYSCPGCEEKLAPKDVAFLSACGHHGCYSHLLAGTESEQCLWEGCKSSARPEAIVTATSLIAPGAVINQPTKNRYGAKMGGLVKLIKEVIPEDEKVLVFVQFQDLMAKVKQVLANAGIPVLDISGTAINKSTALESFQQGRSRDGGKSKVLLLNVGDESASGANLTVANHCIFVSPLYTESPREFEATETQAIGRVVRYGQTKVVGIYRLFADETIDEELWAKSHGGSIDIPGDHLNLN